MINMPDIKPGKGLSEILEFGDLILPLFLPLAIVYAGPHKRAASLQTVSSAGKPMLKVR